MATAKVAIIGGGFGGLSCAKELDGRAIDVVLLDRRTYHLFTPLLYQVASALLNPSAIAYPFRARFRRSPNVRFRQVKVTGVDLEHRSMRTAGDAALGCDYLVLASGSENNYYGNEGLARASIGLKTLEEALRLRNHTLSCLERAAETSNPSVRREWLTFVIAGGGPTGVEYAGALMELLELVCGRDYRDLRTEDARVVLVEGQDRLLPTFAGSSSAYAERALGRRGVDVMTSALVQTASQHSVELSTGEALRARTLVWSAGVRPNVVTGAEAARSGSGRVEVNEHLTVRGHSGVFAIGDAACAPDAEELPMLAPVAMQQGRYVARAILAELEGVPGSDSRRPFRYVDKGTIATIGRNSAVGQIGRLRFTGFAGWVAWLTVHLYYLVGFRNRLVVLTSWAWNYVRRDRPIRIVVRAGEDPLAETTDEAADAGSG
jgi:NADH:ubiquinone reductase (H+-translocating)